MGTDWKKEYDKLILSGKLDEAKDLCTESMINGQKIFKFFRGSNLSFNTIVNNTLWLSRGDKFNDPFDANFFVNCKSKDVYPEEERPLATEEYFKQKEQDSLSLRIQQTSLITSFTECPDSILMWSYYALDHKGFCVEYDLEELTQKLLILPVVYSDEMLQITDYTENNRIIGSLVKAKCWEHEKEWRIVQLADESFKGSGLVVDNIPTPTAFYYGSRIWNNVSDNYKRIKEVKVKCKEDSAKECVVTVGSMYDSDAAVDFNDIMAYTKGKMPLYGFDLCRNEFRLKKITLVQ